MSVLKMYEAKGGAYYGNEMLLPEPNRTDINISQE